MYYIVALGNPGDEYRDTRHNAGWLIADELCSRFHFPPPRLNLHHLGRFTEGVIGDTKVKLLYPDTFMNHSGNAVAKFVPKEDQRRLLIIHDEIALPLGTFKISQGKGAGGHNGVHSIVTRVGHQDFIRIRIGIAPVSWLTGRLKVISGEELPKYVLGRFSRREQSSLDEIKPVVCEAIRSIIVQGVVTAMNRYNALN